MPFPRVTLLHTRSPASSIDVNKIMQNLYVMILSILKRADDNERSPKERNLSPYMKNFVVNSSFGKSPLNFFKLNYLHSADSVSETK